MGSIALLFFVSIAIIHLYARWADKLAAAAITKPFLMPLLYYAVLSLHSVPRMQLIAMAAAFYTLGDICLIFKRYRRVFLAGIFSFMAGHIFYISYFAGCSFSVLFMVISAAVFALPFAVYIWKIRRSGADDFWGFVLYGSMIYIFGTGIGASFSVSAPLASLLSIIGVILFGYSDSRIAYNRAHHADTSDFIIMWTYIAANIALVSAAVMR